MGRKINQGIDEAGAAMVRIDLMIRMGFIGDQAPKLDASEKLERAERWAEALDLGATVKDVAEASGVSRQTVWAHIRARPNQKRRPVPPERWRWRMLSEASGRTPVAVIANCAGHGPNLRSSPDLVVCLECGLSSRDHLAELQPGSDAPRKVPIPLSGTTQKRSKKATEKAFNAAMVKAEATEANRRKSARKPTRSNRQRGKSRR